MPNGEASSRPALFSLVKDRFQVLHSFGIWFFEAYSVTQRWFNDIFKLCFHTIPKQYIIDYKINLAKKLLGVKELSMGNISDKKVTGQTAKDYRNEISDPTV